MSAGSKRSKPAVTAVWVVNRLPARVAANATSNGCPRLLHKSTRALQHREGGVTFVQVADLRLQSERAQQPPSADPEQHFLLQSQLRPAAIQLARDAAMSGKVGGVVAIQQVEFDPAHLDLPGAQPDRVSGQCNLEPQPFAIWLTQGRDGQLSGIVEWEQRLLFAILVDHLAEVALLVQQPYARHRRAQIAGGLELIARHVAQPAGVNGQSLAEHEFHAEVSDAGQPRVRMMLLKPGRRFGRKTAGFHQAVHPLPKCGIGQRMLNLIARDRL